MMAGDVDPEDDGSGEYIDSPDDQADSDDHGDVEDAVGEVQVAEGTHVRQVLRLQGTRHPRSRSYPSAKRLCLTRHRQGLLARRPSLLGRLLHRHLNLSALNCLQFQ